MKCVSILAVVLALLVSPISGVKKRIKDKKETCVIPVTSLATIEPLLLVPGTTYMVRGNTAGNIVLAAGQSIRLACPGTVLTTIGASEANATCVGGVQLTVNGVTYNANQLGCTRWPTLSSWSSGSCLGGRQLAKMGYQISAGNVELIEACHELGIHHTIYAKVILTPEATANHIKAGRPKWIKGHLFVGVNPENLYSRKTERTTFGTILESATLGEKYINMQNEKFLSKGHLVAKADFFYGTGRAATFFYANSLPQWQTLNSGNWNTLEDNVRSFASRHGRNLEVYTGGSFYATLANIKNVQTNLTLITNGQMPVPRMFWKILYDPIVQAGIAFIGLNNPYQTAIEAAADIRCKDISSTVKWLTWQQKNLVRGYSYTCEVEDFRANFPDIPNFKVKSVLR